MEGITPALLMGALVYAVVNFLKYLSAKDWKPVVTQLCAWVGGVLVLLLASASNLAPGIELAGVNLDQANLADLAIFGLMATSLFSVGRDVIKAVDNTQSASVPNWGDSRTDE